LHHRALYAPKSVEWGFSEVKDPLRLMPETEGVGSSLCIVFLADLSGVEGWTEEQLTVAKSLKGATMPNG